MPLYGHDAWRESASEERLLPTAHVRSIVVARPKINAVVNQAASGGYVNTTDFYPGMHRVAKCVEATMRRTATHCTYRTYACSGNTSDSTTKTTRRTATMVTMRSTRC